MINSNKRFLVLSLGLVFALSFVWSLHVVSANVFTDKIGSVWNSIFTSGWKTGNLEIEIARWAFFALLVVLLWGVLGIIPFFSEDNMKKFNPLLAAIISYLAMAYLTPAELYTALVSYSALGIVLGGALPFVILAFFSIKIAKEGKLGGRLLAKFMWFAFIIFLIARLVVVLLNPSSVKGVDSSELKVFAWAYITLLLFAIGWVVRIEKWLMKILLNEDVAFSTAQELEDLIAHWESVEQDWRRSKSKNASVKAEEAHKRVVALTKKRAQYS